MLGRTIGALTRRVPRRYLEAAGVPALRVVTVAIRGNRVECPVCRRRFRRFLPYGRIDLRRNVLCPACLSLERHRLLWLYLTRRTDFFERPLRVLHIAPERCFVTHFEARHGTGYVTADLESGLAKVRMDVQRMAFEDDTFDVVLCNHVLEHVDDDVRATREIFRVLKPGGWAILQSPVAASRRETYEDPTITTPSGREQAFGQRDHVRVYGRDYGQRLASAGFQVTEDEFARTLPSEEIDRYSLPADETVFLCRKGWVLQNSCGDLAYTGSVEWTFSIERQGTS